MEGPKGPGVRASTLCVEFETFVRARSSPSPNSSSPGEGKFVGAGFKPAPTLSPGKGDGEIDSISMRRVITGKFIEGRNTRE